MLHQDEILRRGSRIAGRRPNSTAHRVPPANRRNLLPMGGRRLQWRALQHQSFTDCDTTLLLRAISTMFNFERGMVA